MASSQLKIFIVLALVAAIVCVHAQDYDDEGGNQGNEGYGGYSGGSGEDDYAAPRDSRLVGAEGSDINPGYHESGNENYDGDDSAAAASQSHATIARASLVKLIKRSSR